MKHKISLKRLETHILSGKIATIFANLKLKCSNKQSCSRWANLRTMFKRFDIQSQGVWYSPVTLHIMHVWYHFVKYGSATNLFYCIRLCYTTVHINMYCQIKLPMEGNKTILSVSLLHSALTSHPS